MRVCQQPRFGLTLIFVASSQANITIFDSNSVISSGDSYDVIVIKGDGTVVGMVGGDVNDVITMNTSIFNMYGCNIAVNLCL